MRSVALGGLLVISIWASAMAVLVLIDTAVLAIGSSWLRSLIGLLIFGAWVLAWYLVLRAVVRRVTLSLLRRVER